MSVEKDVLLTKTMSEIATECKRAMAKFPDFHSAHEGYAVLLEEVDELWDAIKHDDFENMREEAVQVAAMALRFVLDVLNEEN